MSDSAFKTAPYAGYTTKELEGFIAAGRIDVARAIAEIKRREAVKAGDCSQMTDGERLRSAQS